MSSGDAGCDPGNVPDNVSVVSTAPNDDDVDIDNALYFEDAESIRQLEVLPEAAQAILTHNFRILTPEHKTLIQDTADYLVQIAPYVHHNKVLKDYLRRILGLKFHFTLNLPWAEAWYSLQEGCADYLTTLGTRLHDIFEAQQLGTHFGGYNPVQTYVAGAMHQYIPSECVPDAFVGNANLVADHDLECTYIHFLRHLALAFDTCFQQTVREQLTAAGIHDFKVTSGGVKSYERMFTKMLAKNDHRNLPKPRPAHNLDIVRCIVTYGSIDDMRRGCEVRCHKLKVASIQ